MRRPVRKIQEKRSKQTLIINLVAVFTILIVVSLVLFDVFKTEKPVKVREEVSIEKSQLPGIPRKEISKSKRRRRSQNKDYKKYQPYFEEREGVEESTFDPQSEARE